MVVDAQSLITFLKDIIELYCNAKYEGVPYPKDMCSYIDQVKKDLAYEAGSKAQQRDREFFRELIEASEPVYNGVNGTDKLDAAREMFKNPKLRSAFNATDDVSSALDISFGSRTDQTSDGFLRKVPGIPGMSFIDGITYLLPENEWTGGCIDQ